MEITLYGRDFPTPGWSLTPGNETDPGPTIRVNLGDEIRLRLVSTDGFPHVFYIDYNGNGFPTPGVEPISQEYNTTTMFNFTADRAGFFTYWCAVHQPDMFGGWITNGPPVVTLTSPLPGVSWTGGTDHAIRFTLTDEDVLQNTTVWANFTYAGGAQGGSIAGPTAGVPNVAVSWSVPRIDATDVRVNLTAIDASGTRSATLSDPFEIDSTPPTVETQVPGPNAQDVPRNTRVKVTWSEAMNETASGDSSSFGVQNTADGTWVAGSAAWDADSRTMTFVPAEFLAGDTSFEVHVNASARDDSEPGNAPSGPLMWRFLTSGVADLEGPAIGDVVASPSVARPGEMVSVGATITDPSGVAAAWVVVRFPDVTLNLTLVRFGDRWYLNRSWEAPGTYQFEIGAQDGAGNLNTAAGGFQIRVPGPDPLLIVAIAGSLAGGVALLVAYFLFRRRGKG